MKIMCAVALLLLAPIAGADAFTQTRFASEDVAHQHCPGAMVVWLTLPGNIFVLKADARYGTTPRGAYMCERDAIAAGGHASH